MTDAQVTLGVSCDPAGEMDARILRLLYPGAGERAALADEERRLLQVLRGHMGAANAIQIARLGLRLDLEPRAVKAAACGLVVKFGLPVVGSRQPPYGYFIALTHEEMEHARAILLAEVGALAQRLVALGASEEAIVLHVRKAVAGEEKQSTVDGLRSTAASEESEGDTA